MNDVERLVSNISQWQNVRLVYSTPCLKKQATLFLL